MLIASPLADELQGWGTVAGASLTAKGRFGTFAGRFCLDFSHGQARPYRQMMAHSTIWARELAAARMAEPLPRRWAHVQAVAAKAESLRPLLGEDADLLVVAAWLHDIGYAPDIQDTGFHPLDGAGYLRRLDVDPRLCGLVANHSGAKYEAELRGLVDEFAEFPDEDSLARDGVWYCDMTTSPVGLPVTFDARLAEIRERYGEDHSVPRAITAASDEIRAAIDHVQTRACQFGLASL